MTKVKTQIVFLYRTILNDEIDALMVDWCIFSSGELQREGPANNWATPTKLSNVLNRYPKCHNHRLESTFKLNIHLFVINSICCPYFSVFFLVKGMGNAWL